MTIAPQCALIQAQPLFHPCSIESGMMCKHEECARMFHRTHVFIEGKLYSLYEARKFKNAKEVTNAVSVSVGGN